MENLDGFYSELDEVMKRKVGQVKGDCVLTNTFPRENIVERNRSGNAQGGEVMSDGQPRRYWYDEKRNAVWPYDGTYGGDECLRLLIDVEDVEAMLQSKPDSYSGPPPGVTKPSKLPPPPPRQK